MLSFRPATIADAKFLWELRNDEKVRSLSFEQDLIAFPDHLRWLTEILSNPNHFLYIILQEENAIGQVRFDLSGKEAEISIALVAEARGRGYGQEAIRKISLLFLVSHPGCKIIARITLNNKASIKSFSKSGYQEQDRASEFITLTFDPLK